MKKQHIMVTLDGSRLGESILQSVRSLFKPADADLLLIRVVNPIDYGHVTSAFLPTITWDPKLLEQVWIDQRNIIKEELTHDMQLLENEGFQVELLMPVGDPVQEITQCAEEKAVDLIAMATHGRTGLPRLVMGSVAEGVLRQSHVPVLMLRPGQALTGGQLTLNFDVGVNKDFAMLLGGVRQVA